MRHDWLNIAFKLAKQLHVEKLLYIVAKITWHPQIIVPLHPQEYLYSVCPDSHATCIHHNTISPLYDVHIIIPVYNAAPYLEECLQSILTQQTRYTFHITAVNDGSTDISLDILNQYAIDKRITVVSQTNQGQAAARNCALEHILGRYILFVDADDMLAEGVIEKMVNIAEETGVDLVAGNTIRFNSTHTWGQTHIHDLTQSSPIWAKIHRAQLWENRCFPINNKFEDTIFPLLIEPTIQSYKIIDEIVYYYRDTPNSVSAGNVCNPRRLETLYVTQIALETAKEEQIPFTQNQYHLFLHQCWHNTKRVAILGNHTLDYIVYEEQCKLHKLFFENFQANANPYCTIEQHLELGDFRLWYLFCLST